MIKKITFFAFSILLLFSNLSFSQTENPYLNFNPKELKKNKDYVKNYNPITCKPKILYNCMLDMINAARAEYAFAAGVVKHTELDSMAILQGEYMGKKNLKTSENKMGLSSLDDRFESRGFSHCGTELLTKAKTANGIEEYTYYDVCLELLKPILKNTKDAKILLDKKYTYVGLGWGIDKDMKTIFLSIVLANDRTIAPRPAKGKNNFFTKGQNGLKGYDEKICQKCLNEKNLELLSDYVRVEGDQVYFVCDDYKALRKLIGKEGDALMLDFVQTNQYPCDGNIITDNNLVNRGLTTIPFTYQQLLEFNENTDKKSTKLRAHIDNVPEEIDGNDFEVNILVIKGDIVCRNILKKKVEDKNSAYTEKINLMKDTLTIETTGAYIPSAEEGKIEAQIPFTDIKKVNYTFDEINAYFANLNYPYYNIDKIEIIVHNSLNYKKDAAQAKIQKQRGESMQKAFNQKYPNTPVEVTYDFNWEAFKKDLVNSGDYYDLTFLQEDEAYAEIMANKGKIAKAIENEYLKKHRYAQIILHVTFPVDEKHEEDFVVYKFNQLSAKKKPNIPLLAAMQEYAMRQVEAGKYGNDVLTMKVPYKHECQQMLNNQLYMQCLLEGKVSSEMCAQVNDIAGLKPAAAKGKNQPVSPKANPVIEYNKMVCKLQNLALKNSTEITTIQSSIDQLYTYPSLNQATLNTLNLEFQIKFLEFLQKQPVTTENTTLLNSTYDKIKAVRNPKLDTWQNAYKLAAIFAQNHDYSYALSLMDPFLDDATLSNDFIFSYISIASSSENVYLSDNFAKMVELAATKDRSRLCTLTNKLSTCILENAKVKAILCKECK